MSTCAGHTCQYYGYKRPPEELNQYVVNGYDRSDHSKDGTPRIILFCDNCEYYADRSRCCVCNLPMLDESLDICGHPVCRLCLDRVPRHTCPDPAALNAFLDRSDLEDAHGNWVLSIGDAEIAGLEKWFCAFLDELRRPERERKRKRRENRSLAEEHLRKRGYTEWEAFQLIEKFGRKVRYLNHVGIVKKLLEKE